MSDLQAEALSEQRVEVALLGTMAGLALLLSAVGIFALVASLVTQRTREIGIRIALGSTIRQAMTHVSSSGVRAAGSRLGARSRALLHHTANDAKRPLWRRCVRRAQPVRSDWNSGGCDPAGGNHPGAPHCADRPGNHAARRVSRASSAAKLPIQYCQRPGLSTASAHLLWASRDGQALHCQKCQ